MREMMPADSRDDVFKALAQPPDISREITPPASRVESKGSY